MKSKTDGVSILFALFFAVVIVVSIIAVMRMVIIIRKGEESVKKQKIGEKKPKIEGEWGGEDNKEKKELIEEEDGDDVIDLLEESRMKQILSEEIKRAATTELIYAAFENVLSDSSWLPSPVTADDVNDAIMDSSASHIFETSFKAHLSSAISEKVEGAVDDRIKRLRPFLRPTTFAVDITAYDDNRLQPEDVAGSLDDPLQSVHAKDKFLPVFRYMSKENFTTATSGSSIEPGLHMLFEKSSTYTTRKTQEEFNASITVFNNLGYFAVMYGTVYCNGPGSQLFSTLTTKPGESVFGVPVRGVKTFTWKMKSFRRPISSKLFFSFLVHRTSS